MSPVQWGTPKSSGQPRGTPKKQRKTEDIAKRPQSDDDFRENGHQKQTNGISKATIRPQSDDRFVKIMKKYKKE